MSAEGVEKLPSGKYRARLYFRARYVASRTFVRRRDAVAWKRRQELLLASGLPVHPDDSGTRFEDWAAEWLATKGGTPTSRATRETMLRVHILPTFGRQPLSMITTTQVQKWARQLVDRRSTATARQALAPMKQIMAAAYAEGLIFRDPTTGVRLSKPRPNEPRPLTHEEVWRLADAAATTEHRVMFLTAAYAGLRFGELSALRRRNVKDGQLRITHAFAEVGGRLVEGGVKSHQARTVPLPDRVHAELVAWAATRDADDALLFTTSTGTPYRNGNWRRSVLNPALDRSGLPAHVTPHHFRDTAASLAIEAGASVVVVARMLGHENANTTLTHYAALFPDSFDRISERMNEAIERITPATADPSIDS